MQMKQRILLLILLCSTVFAASAQLTDGSIAPDWTATDIDGVEHNLYDILSEGKKVIIQFSATWCGPCWSYHNSGVLEELYELYGPDGTDELRIFFMEADDSTTDADLNGTSTNTWGDWTAGVEYPIIDNCGSIFDDYAGAYYPTIYTICPNRILTESGQIGVEEHHAVFSANDCAAASLPNDPALLSYTGGTTACPGEPVNMSVDMMNLGVTNLQYATIDVMVGGNSVLSYDWSGDLETYGITNVDLGTATFDADTDFTIEITSADDNDANNMADGAVAIATDATSLIHVEIMIDNWPEEIGWSISDDVGNVVEEVTEGSVGGSAGDVVEWWVELPSEGCYAFEITDAYGDGISGAQWGSIDGYCEVTSWHDANNLASVIYSYDGSYDFESEQAGMSVSNLPFTLEGCMDETACNYNPAAEEEDGSCTYPGCQDALAVNYDDDAGCAGECLYLEYTCEEIGNEAWGSLETAAYPDWQEAMHGVAWEGEWVLHIANQVAEPTTQVVYPVHHFEWTGLSGLPEWAVDVSYELGDVGPGAQRCISASGIPTTPGLHEIQVMGELFISIFGQPFSTGMQTYAALLEVSENPNPIAGCTYPLASNHVSYATVDDGSCLFPGCTDPEAGNFSPIANVDDGSCGDGCTTEPTAGCSTDNNGDGVVNVTDLLALLGEFGNECE